MKRLLILMSIIMATACTNKEKILVAYFSATGTTKAVAERISNAASAELFEIQPSVPYSDADLDWRDSTSRSSLEMKDLSSRPAVAFKVNGLDSFDKIFIGFPIWWYTAPTIINTFFEENDLKGKTVILFATSGSSDIDKACEDLRNAYPELEIVGGKLLNSPSDEEIKDFVNAYSVQK